MTQPTELEDRNGGATGRTAEKTLEVEFADGASFSLPSLMNASSSTKKTHCSATLSIS